jgi:hypothetical protein
MAAAQLRELITLLNADDSDPMMADLRLLAEDFLRLAEPVGRRRSTPARRCCPSAGWP